jgi:hypothetical protein
MVVPINKLFAANQTRPTPLLISLSGMILS